MQNRLGRKTVALLDLTRAAAAVYVVLYHVAVERGWTGEIGLVFRFGQEAVMLFFLLSGFVIHANERRRVAEGFGYAFRRIRRIYPALIFAMMVSAVVALIDGRLASSFSMAEFLGTLFALQDIAALKPGVIVDPFLGNAALWTLSYEIFFYLLYPFAMAAWREFGARTSHLVGIVSCLSYLSFTLAPDHWTLVLAYYGVWWTGAMAAEAYLEGRRDLLALRVPLAWLALLCAVSGIDVWRQGVQGLGVYPFLQLRHFAVAFLAVVIGFGPVGAWLSRKAQRVEKPAAAVASISYGLYVLHFPLLVLSSLAATTLGLFEMSVVLVFLSWFADRYLNERLPRWKVRRAAMPKNTA